MLVNGKPLQSSRPFNNDLFIYSQFCRLLIFIRSYEAYIIMYLCTFCRKEGRNHQKFNSVRRMHRYMPLKCVHDRMTEMIQDASLWWTSLKAFQRERPGINMTRCSLHVCEAVQAQRHSKLTNYRHLWHLKNIEYLIVSFWFNKHVSQKTNDTKVEL